MLIVIDDVLCDKDVLAVQNCFASDEARAMRWITGNYTEALQHTSPLTQLLAIAGQYFSLRDMDGVEFWAHLGTYPGWHVDRDEALAETTGEITHPICSIVYYGNIDGLVGGAFRTETEVITPKTNRMLMFSPGLLHSVDNYTGTRLSVAVNPWVKKPLGYT